MLRSLRQARYSEKNEKSLDLVLFLNGIPLFTTELKNPFTGQIYDADVRICADFIRWLFIYSD